MKSASAWGRDLLQFLRLAARPVRRGPAVFNLILTGGGWAGVAVAVWLVSGSHLLISLLVLTLVALALALVAGTRLQRRVSDQMTARVTCVAQIESIPHTLTVNGQQFKCVTALWVVVNNDGPGASFEARIRDIRNLDSQQSVP